MINILKLDDENILVRSYNYFFDKGALPNPGVILKQAKKLNNFENPSGTGQNIVGITSLAAPFLGAYSSVTTGNLTGLGLAGTAFLTPYGMRYLMTNKKFMNWLISSGKEVIDNRN